MSEYVYLVNATDKPLSLVYEGTAIRFRPQGQPGSLVQLPKAAADYVRGHVGDQVKVVESASFKSLIEKPRVEVFYLANMSGNPDAPEFFEEEFVDVRTGKYEKKRTYNELREPQVFKARLGMYSGVKPPNTLRYKDGEGNMVYNKTDIQVTLPGRLIEIPPFGRVEVTREQFETLMQRDLNRPETRQGQLVKSRAPSEFEPEFNDPKWTIDNLRLWLELVPATGEKFGGKEVMGPSEADIKAANSSLSELELSMKLHEVRFDLWKRCALRAADPEFTLPKESDFNAAKARKAKGAKSESASAKA